ncbi:MAG: DUF4830 domain-containing protein [Clostridia bacterium]|nr:DUF4830 domain-containing protein [Clostridia bacterium]
MHKLRRHHSAVIITLLAAAITVGVIFILFGSDSKINQSNLDFIRSFGWEIKESPEQISHITIPQEFNLIFETYNKLENNAGFDLSGHRGEKAVRYSYIVTNHKASPSGLIRANVYITKCGIVAGDICSLELGGFIQSINDTTGMVE